VKEFSGPAGFFIDMHDNIYVADSGYYDGWKRCIRVGSLKDRKVIAFIPDPVQNATGTSAAERGVVDSKGNIYGAEVGPMALKKYVRKYTIAAATIQAGMMFALRSGWNTIDSTGVSKQKRREHEHKKKIATGIPC
jgi:hypothetical protein